MANAEVPEVIDRATVNKYCEEYCKNKINRQCQKIIQENRDEDIREFDESVNKTFSYLKNVMIGIGLYFLYKKIS